MKYEKLTNDINWLVTMLPAFEKRFNEDGIEDERCFERFNEMHEVIALMSSVIGLCSLDKSQALHPLLFKFECSLNDLIDLPRNAHREEVIKAGLELSTVVREMAKTFESMQKARHSFE